MTRAPYAPGDRVNVLHDSNGHGTALGVFTINRVVPLNTNNRWRIEMDRCDGSMITAVVNERGRDRHGYVERTVTW